jgi:hypothetical protein
MKSGISYWLTPNDSYFNMKQLITAWAKFFNRELKNLYSLPNIIGFMKWRELKSSMLWDITPRSPLKVNRRYLAYSSALKMEAIFSSEMLVSFSAYSNLKMEAMCFSETSIDFQRTTRRYIPEDSTLLQLYITTRYLKSTFGYLITK